MDAVRLCNITMKKKLLLTGSTIDCQQSNRPNNLVRSAILTAYGCIEGLVLGE